MIKEYQREDNKFWQPKDPSGEYVVIYQNGTKYFFQNRKLHRSDGPAIIDAVKNENHLKGR